MNIIEREKQRLARAVAAKGQMATSSGTTKPKDWLFDVGYGNADRAARGLARVTPVIAERHATVYSCCNVVAGDLSKVPLRVWQRNEDGSEAPVRDHPLAYLLNVEASPGVPANVTRFMLGYTLLLRGNAVASGPRTGGGDLEMIDLVHPDRWQMYEMGRARFYDFEDGAGVQRRAASREIVHLRNAPLDGWTGRSPLQVAADSVGLALSGQDAAARNASGVTTKAVIKLDDSYESDEDRVLAAKRVKMAMRDPENDGIPVLGPDEDIKSLELSAADKELLSSRKFDREMIAGIYRVPPSKLQMLEFGVKANGQQQALDYRTDCLLHWGGMTEGQMALALFTQRERQRGLFLRHDYSVLLEPTTQELFSALYTATGGPFMKPNEARRMARLQGDIDGGEVLYPAPNMTREADAGADQGGQDGED